MRVFPRSTVSADDWRKLRRYEVSAPERTVQRKGQMLERRLDPGFASRFAEPGGHLRTAPAGKAVLRRSGEKLLGADMARMGRRRQHKAR